MHLLQYAHKVIKNSSSFIADSTRTYVLSLLLSIGKKNCAAMSDELGIPYKSIYRYFDEFKCKRALMENFFTDLANSFATTENPGVLLVDTTQIMKLYSKESKMLCYDFNGSMKSIFKGLSCVTAAWCNGEILVPLDFDFWVREKDIKDGRKYKKKTTIAQGLILKWKDKVKFAYLSLDGDYGNEAFLRFLHQNKLLYAIRMPKNRKVSINNRPEKTLKDQPFFHLKRNERYKTTRCNYKGIKTYVTCQKRKGHNNTKQIVFVVSNLEKLSPKEYIEAYELRWSIEKMFRTTKQHLGLQHCQSISEEKQRAHIFAIFLAFTELELQKIDKKKKSPEAILKVIRNQNHVKINQLIIDWEGFIM